MSGPRFDEIELRSESDRDEVEPHPAGSEVRVAPLWRRAIATFVDLSLLAALIFAFKPLHPPAGSWSGWISLAAFLLLFSLYYFTTSWMVWGRTLGAAILAIRVAAEDEIGVTFRRAMRRWAGTMLSVATAGIGFLITAIPPHRSLSDRLSDTTVVSTV